MHRFKFAAAAFLLAAPLVCGAAPAEFGGAAPARAQSGQVSVSAFFGDLQPYGSWVQDSRYDYIWIPDVSADWSPYTKGHWVFVRDVGWFFESDEPFAWVVYHYGRWGYDDDIGWYWVPGTRWAPSWVAWRRSDDYVGWAPLPPTGRGFAVSVSVDIGAVPRTYWRFVPAQRFLEPNLSTVVIYERSRPEIFTRTRPLGTVRIQNNIVVNNVLNINFIEQHTKERVTIREPERVSRPQDARQADNGRSVKIVEERLAPPERSEKPTKLVSREEIRTHHREARGRGNGEERNARVNEQEGKGGANAQNGTANEVQRRASTTEEQNGAERNRKKSEQADVRLDRKRPSATESGQESRRAEANQESQGPDNRRNVRKGRGNSETADVTGERENARGQASVNERTTRQRRANENERQATTEQRKPPREIRKGQPKSDEASASANNGRGIERNRGGNGRSQATANAERERPKADRNRRPGSEERTVDRGRTNVQSEANAGSNRGGRERPSAQSKGPNRHCTPEQAQENPRACR